MLKYKTLGCLISCYEHKKPYSHVLCFLSFQCAEHNKILLLQSSEVCINKISTYSNKLITVPFYKVLLIQKPSQRYVLMVKCLLNLLWQLHNEKFHKWLRKSSWYLSFIQWFCHCQSKVRFWPWFGRSKISPNIGQSVPNPPKSCTCKWMYTYAVVKWIGSFSRIWRNAGSEYNRHGWVCWRDNSLSTAGSGEGRLLKQTELGVPAGRAAWHRTGHREKIVWIWKLHFTKERKRHNWCYLT